MQTKIAVVGLPGKDSTEKLADEIAALTGFRLVIDCGKILLDFPNRRVSFEGTDLGALDGIVIKKVGETYSPDMLDRIQMLHYLNAVSEAQFFPTPKKIFKLIDRFYCTQKLQLAEIPMPETAITEDVDLALEILARYQRAIFKPLYSTKSRGMAMITDGSQAKVQIEKFKASGNTVMYIQKVVSHLGRDLGVCFLGEDYIGTYARVGTPGSWNTTTFSGGRYAGYEPAPEVIDMAKRARDLFQLDFTCVDVVETDEGPRVFEVSAFGGFRGLESARNLNVAKMYAEYLLRQLKK